MITRKHLACSEDVKTDVQTSNRSMTSRRKVAGPGRGPALSFAD